MKKLLILICLLFFAVGAILNAQQDARYSQYMFNGLRLNPAYAGSKDHLSIAAFYRNQWTRIEGAPKTFSIGLHDAVGEKDRVGLGLFVEHDRIGVDNRSSVYGSYAYKIKLNDDTYLSAGLQAGLVFHQSLLTQVITPEDGFDPSFSEDISSVRPNFGAGLFYYGKDYYIGASIPHLLAYQQEADNFHRVSRLRGNYREYLVNAGATFHVKKNVDVMPSFLVQYIPAEGPVEIDINCSLLLNESAWLGITYRSNQIVEPESLNFQVAYQLNNGLKIGYAYDQTIAKIAYYVAGSHEIMLGYDLQKKQKKSEEIVFRFW